MARRLDHRAWDDRMRDVLRRGYPVLGPHVMAAVLGRTMVATRQQAWMIGVGCPKLASRCGGRIGRRRDPTPEEITAAIAELKGD